MAVGEQTMGETVGKAAKEAEISLLVGGGLAIVLGLILLASPRMTLSFFLALFGVFALVDGFMAVVSAFWRERQHPRWILFLWGVLSFAAGVAVFVWPEITAVTLLLVIATWAVAIGVLRLAEAIALRDVLASPWLVGVGGVASIAFGIAAIVRPSLGALTLAGFIGAFVLIYGVALFVAGLRVSSLRSMLGMGRARAEAPA